MEGKQRRVGSLSALDPLVVLDVVRRTELVADELEGFAVELKREGVGSARKGGRGKGRNARYGECAQISQKWENRAAGRESGNSCHKTLHSNIPSNLVRSKT